MFGVAIAQFVLYSICQVSNCHSHIIIPALNSKCVFVFGKFLFNSFLLFFIIYSRSIVFTSTYSLLNCVSCVFFDLLLCEKANVWRFVVMLLLLFCYFLCVSVFNEFSLILLIFTGFINSFSLLMFQTRFTLSFHVFFPFVLPFLISFMFHPKIFCFDVCCSVYWNTRIYYYFSVYFVFYYLLFKSFDLFLWSYWLYIMIFRFGFIFYRFGVVRRTWISPAFLDSFIFIDHLH